jgi:hypothetical protein
MSIVETGQFLMSQMTDEARKRFDAEMRAHDDAAWH